MDAEEARLLDEIKARREDIANHAENLKRSVTELLDPRERIKRHPLRGLLTTVGTGIVLGRLMGGRSIRKESIEPEPQSAEPDSPLLSFAASVLPGLLPTLLPAIVGPLASLILPRGSSRRGKKTNSH